MISVLSSVYNETLDEIRESLDSILAQSYKDFELIVVLDRPDYAEGLALLQDYAAKDARVKVLVNEKNIGLALSMNHAAENAKGEYYLRMDADDVCLPGRFQLQFDAIRNSDYDLVCGNYDFMDENGKLLPQKPPLYTDGQMNVLLSYRNIIHHPTVIMKAKAFWEAGAYRNYPCAQDYDLWLRMKCNGCKMHMVPEKLIKYRVRQASTTVQKRYKQACTGAYIRKLYEQRNNMADYSYEGYLSYLEKRGVNEPGSNEDFVKNFDRYMQLKRKLRKGRILSAAADFYQVMFRSKYYRPHILRSVKIALVMKFAK